jgi:hypothetical protein
MSFPVSPTNGQQSTIANIVYQYASATNAWTVVPGYANSITATGNIAASYFLGNGSQLTGVVATGVTGMTYGTTSITIPVSSGNANASISGTSNVVVWASTGQYVTGVISATGNITASGNLSGSYLLGNGTFITGLSASKIFNGTSEANIGTSGGNANITIGGTSNVVVVAATGVLVTGTISASGNINTTGGNGVANIGAVGAYFNTVHAKATSAQYADLAEMYQGDQTYMPGTVVEFGGSHEVTMTTTASSTSIAGVVSTNPSYLMNSGLTSLNSVPVALTGRVPCQVLGPVKKGDRLVSSMLPGVAQVLDETTYKPGCMIGKSLDNWPEASVKLIEVVVGRL